MTKEYYSRNSSQYIEDTKNRDMKELYAFYEKHLPSETKRILEIGFGSGRDSLYFQNIKGYEVTSLDQCTEFCEHGKEIGLKHILNMNVLDMDFSNEFDGIWACASLVHIGSNDLKNVLLKCSKALKKNGAMYVSIKYGNYEGERDGRFYHDVTEESFAEYAKGTGLEIVDTLITYDKRKEPYVKWLNAVLIKTEL